MLPSRDLPDLGIVLPIGNSVLNHQTFAMTISDGLLRITVNLLRHASATLPRPTDCMPLCLHLQTENCTHTVLEFDPDYRNRLPVCSRDERDSQTKNLVLASLMIRICSDTEKCE